MSFSVDLTEVHLSNLRFRVTRADGKTVDFGNVVNSLRITDHVNTASAEVSIEIQGPVEEVLKIGNVGTSCRITGLVPDIESGGNLERLELWRGTFEDVSIDSTPAGAQALVTAYDLLHALTTDEEDYVIQNPTLASLVRRLAEDFSIPVGTIPATEQTLGTVIARGEPLYSGVLQKAIQKHKNLTGEVYYLVAENGRMSLRKQGDDDLFWMFSVPYGSALKFRQQKSLRDVINKVKVYGVFEGEEDKPPLEHVAENENSQGLYGLRQRVEYIPAAEDASRVVAAAKQQISLFSAPDDVTEFVTFGLPLLRAGQRVHVRYPEFNLNRKMYVESVETEFTASHSQTLVACRREPVDPGLVLDEVTAV